jgi:naringenin degradation protein FdeJ
MVTGAGGFVGREVLKRLAESTNAHVVAFDANLSGVQAHARLSCFSGDVADAVLLADAIGEGVDAVIHLAAVPGGAAEADPMLSQRVNVDASLNLLGIAAAQPKPPRVVFASTIAVFGDPLPATGVDDATPLKPRLLYGAHKAMIETMVATLSRRGAINGLSLRLPGIVARPRGPSGMKSAFMSNLFHALRDGQAFVSPVSSRATLWLMSVGQCADNLVRALSVDPRALPEHRALTLPALRISMAELVGAVVKAAGSHRERVSYQPDTALEVAFGAHPSLATPMAEAAGFTHDGDVDTLVSRALAVISRS